MIRFGIAYPVVCLFQQLRKQPKSEPFEITQIGQVTHDERAKFFVVLSTLKSASKYFTLPGIVWDKNATSESVRKTTNLSCYFAL